VSALPNRPDWLYDPIMQQYFTSLPAIVQESIHQSGMRFDDERALRAFVEEVYRKT